MGAPYFVPSSAFGANERIVMGIIGSGGRGRGVMRDLMEGGAQFAAVCDVYEPNLNEGIKVAESAGGKATRYLDYDEMLDKQTDLDAILIATPEHQHCTQLVHVVASGRDCYCEKPFSHTIEEGAKTVCKVREYNQIVQVGMQRRSSPMVRQGKEVIDSGALGDIHFVRAKWNWQYSSKLDNSPLGGELDVKRFISPARRIDFEPMKFRYWRYFWKFSGGNCTDQGTHLMDVVQWYMGEEFNPATPREAECFGQVYKMEGAETPDVFSAVFRYDGFIATWTLDYVSSFNNSWSLEFLGSKATMVLDDHGWRVYEEPWETDRRQPWHSGKPPAQMVRAGIPTRPHTDNFLECVKSREEPNCPVEIGHIAVCGPHLANVAWHKGKRARLNKNKTKAKT